MATDPTTRLSKLSQTSGEMLLELARSAIIGKLLNELLELILVCESNAKHEVRSSCYQLCPAGIPKRSSI
jgi:hypothetical protein